MKELGAVLDELADPEARNRLDRFRLVSRHRLTKRDEQIRQILEKHGDAFAGPEKDPYAVIDSRAEEVLVLAPASNERTAETA